jgi:hypothetical protein
MKINKYLIIFLVLIIIFFFYTLYKSYLNKTKYSYNSLENFEDNPSSTDIPSSTINESDNEKGVDVSASIFAIKDYTFPYNRVLMENLVKNGDFSNGITPQNNIGSNGMNNIIQKRNPSTSSYVLWQSKTNYLTYYELLCNSVPNSKYRIYFWISVDGGGDLKNVYYEQLINIRIIKQNSTNYIPKIRYSILETKDIISKRETTSWYLIEGTFISAFNTRDKMNVYINYNDNIQFTSMFFADLSLYRVLIDAENFIFNDGLICYTEGYDYSGNNKTWRDLSGNGNDLFFSDIPIINNSTGSVNTIDSKLTGFSSNNLSTDKFTIAFILNNTDTDNDGEDDENTDTVIDNNNLSDANIKTIKKKSLLAISGNDNYSFEIFLYNNYIYAENNDQFYHSDVKLVLINKTMITIVFENQKMTIYSDGLKILSIKTNKLFYTKKNIQINRYKNLNITFYGILFYNRVVPTPELQHIRTYFITNKNKYYNVPNLTREVVYTPQNMSPNISYNTKLNASIPFLKIYDENNLNILNANTSMVTTPPPSLSPTPKKNNLDLSFINKIIPNSIHVDDKNKCPSIYKKNNNYNVYIYRNSIYYKDDQFSNEISYGSDINKAKKLYHLNYPKCPIPDELLYSEKKNIKCPFVVNELNPCYVSSCSDVEWNKENITDLNLNNICKKAVSNYCIANKDIDEKCASWRDDNKNSEESKKIRKFIDNPDDYCDINNFNIEDHPDFSKYIRKDNIPCWGCNLAD